MLPNQALKTRKFSLIVYPYCQFKCATEQNAINKLGKDTPFVTFFFVKISNTHTVALMKLASVCWKYG